MKKDKPSNPKSSRTRRPKQFCCWETKRPTRKANISLEEIEPFDARGMRNIYGRGDHHPGLSACHMDVWLAKNGRVLVRFWSRSTYLDWFSYELHGLVVPVASLSRVLCENEALIPAVVRDQYDEWVIECVEYPYE